MRKAYRDVASIEVLEEIQYRYHWKNGQIEFSQVSFLSQKEFCIVETMCYFLDIPRSVIVRLSVFLSGLDARDVILVVHIVVWV